MTFLFTRRLWEDSGAHSIDLDRTGWTSSGVF